MPGPCGMTKAYCSLDSIRTDDPGPPMFKDLRAGTKFLILCGVSLALTSVATYALLTEKQIAISFVNSELVGSKYLAMLRPIYRAVLDTQSEANPAGRQIASPTDAVASLSRADIDTDFC